MTIRLGDGSEHMSTLQGSNFGLATNSAIFSGISDERRLLAQDRDQRVRALERQHVSTWSELAELCQLIEEQRDWEILGYESYGKWLVDAAPQSRSGIYAARGILKELNEIPQAELRQIPPGNAKILAKVPKSQRSENLLSKAKEQRPREFTAHVQQTHPDLHIETLVPRKFKFEESQGKIIDAAMLMANIIETGEFMEEADLAPEVLLEKICADYMDRHRGIYDRIRRGETNE